MKKLILRGDRFKVLIYIVCEVALLFLASDYYSTLNDLTNEPIALMPADKEQENVEDLARVANTGSWEDFEKARNEEVAHYLQANLKPSSGHALYLYPETLPPHSLERDFANHDLKPCLNALKKACKTRKKDEVSKAYRKLRSRVENYEIGATDDASHLSNDAKDFLKLYQELSRFPLDY